MMVCESVVLFVAEGQRSSGSAGCRVRGVVRLCVSAPLIAVSAGGPAGREATSALRLVHAAHHRCGLHLHRRRDHGVGAGDVLTHHHHIDLNSCCFGEVLWKICAML